MFFAHAWHMCSLHVQATLGLLVQFNQSIYLFIYFQMRPSLYELYNRQWDLKWLAQVQVSADNRADSRVPFHLFTLTSSFSPLAATASSAVCVGENKTYRAEMKRKVQSNAGSAKKKKKRFHFHVLLLGRSSAQPARLDVLSTWDGQKSNLI